MSSTGITQIDHIGIAVREMETAIKIYSQMLGLMPEGEEIVESEKVKTCFFQVGSVRIELLQGTAPDSAITGFIEKHGPGIHHIAFRVTNLDAAISQLNKSGFRILEPYIRKGAHNTSVSFIHPKSTGGLLVELCQK